MIQLSNVLADLAEQVKATNAASEEAARKGVEKALETGRLLIRAKEACAHGDWLHFLERAGVNERQAQRLMQLARSGLISDTVSDLGGIKGALSFLAGWRLPDFAEALLITSRAVEEESGEEEAFVGGPVCYVWESAESRGYYNIAVLHGDELSATKDPMAPMIEMEGANFLNPILYFLGMNSGIALDDWRLEFHKRRLAQAVLPDYVWQERVRVVALQRELHPEQAELADASA